MKKSKKYYLKEKARQDALLELEVACYLIALAGVVTLVDLAGRKKKKSLNLKNKPK